MLCQGDFITIPFDGWFLSHFGKQLPQHQVITEGCIDIYIVCKYCKVLHSPAKKVASSNGFQRLVPSSYFLWSAQILCRCPGMIAAVSQAVGLRGSQWLLWSGRFVRSRSRRQTAAQGLPPPARTAQLSGHSAKTPRASLHARSEKHQAKIWFGVSIIEHFFTMFKNINANLLENIYNWSWCIEQKYICPVFGLGWSRTCNLYFPWAIARKLQVTRTLGFTMIQERFLIVQCVLLRLRFTPDPGNAENCRLQNVGYDTSSLIVLVNGRVTFSLIKFIHC